MAAAWMAIVALLIGGVSGVAFVGDPFRNGAGVALPDTPAGRQLQWVLDALAEAPTEEEVEEHFNAEFLKELPPERLLAIFQTLRGDGPFFVSAIEDSSDYRLVVMLQGHADRYRTHITVQPQLPFLISGLFFADATPSESVASWDALDERLRRSAPEVGFLAAEIVDGECRPVHAIEPDRPLSLGSVFKLYVLGAAVDAVRSGRVAWTTPIEVRDDARVHTSGFAEYVPAGESRPLEELAQQMIEISDNTATDLVLEAVGRENVEAAQAEMGMAAPARNVPFLSTREMSLIKFAREPRVDEYVALDAESRRAFLAQQLAGRPAKVEDLRLSEQPVAVDTVEWFASASDLCRAQVALHSKGPEVRRMLAHNIGERFGPDAAYRAFKAGSEPGVLAGSWYVEHSDGRRFAISILLRNSEGAIDPRAFSVAADAFRLASESP